MKLVVALLVAVSVFAQEPSIIVAPPVGSDDGTVIATAQGVVFLAWTEPHAIRWLLFDSQGSPLTMSSTIALTSQDSHLAAAASAATFLLAWDDDGVVRAQTVALDGSIVKSRTIAEDGSRPAAASDGVGFVIAWLRQIPLRGLFFDVLARSFDRTDIHILTDSNPATDGPLLAVWAGGDYCVAWNQSFVDWGGAFARYVTREANPSGRVVNLVPVLKPARDRVLSAAFDGSEILFAGALALLRSDGLVRFSSSHLPSGFKYLGFDGHDYVSAAAPIVVFQRPFAAIADRGSIHIVSTVRRRATAAR